MVLDMKCGALPLPKGNVFLGGFGSHESLRSGGSASGSGKAKEGPKHKAHTSIGVGLLLGFGAGAVAVEGVYKQDDCSQMPSELLHAGSCRVRCGSEYGSFKGRVRRI